MRLPAFLGARLFRTQAFRIVLVYVVLFALSVTAIIGFTYWNTRRALDEQTDEIIAAEFTDLMDQWNRRGLEGLAYAITTRSSHSGQGIYVLANQGYSRIVGNLDRWPLQSQQVDGFIEFEYQRFDNKSESRQARGRAF